MTKCRPYFGLSCMHGVTLRADQVNVGNLVQKPFWSRLIFISSFCLDLTVRFSKSEGLLPALARLIDEGDGKRCFLEMVVGAAEGERADKDGIVRMKTGGVDFE